MRFCNASKATSSGAFLVRSTAEFGLAELDALFDAGRSGNSFGGSSYQCQPRSHWFQYVPENPFDRSTFCAPAMAAANSKKIGNRRMIMITPHSHLLRRHAVTAVIDAEFDRSAFGRFLSG